MDGRWVMLHRWGLRRGRDSDCALVARSEKRQQKYPEKPWTMTGSLVAPWLVTSFVTHCCGIAYNFSSSNQVWLCWSHWHEQHAQTDPTRSLVPDQTKYLEIATGLQNVILRSLCTEITSNDDKPCFSSEWDPTPQHHTASTKSCYSTVAAITMMCRLLCNQKLKGRFIG